MGQAEETPPQDIPTIQLWSAYVSKVATLMTRKPYSRRVCHIIFLTAHEDWYLWFWKTNSGSLYWWLTTENSTHVEFIQPSHDLRSSSTSTYSRTSKQDNFFLELHTTTINNHNLPACNHKSYSYGRNCCSRGSDSTCPNWYSLLFRLWRV